MIDNLAGYRILFWKSISFWILILFLHCLTFRQCYGESSPRSFDSSHCLCGVVFPILLHSAETCGIFSLSPMFLKAKLQLDISVFWSNVLDTQWTFSIWQFRLSHFLGNFFPFPCFFFFFFFCSLFLENLLFGCITTAVHGVAKNRTQLSDWMNWTELRKYYSWFSYCFIAIFYLWIFCSTFWKPLLNLVILLLGFSFLLLCLLSFTNFFIP